MSKTIRAFGYEWDLLDEEYETAFGKGILCLMKEPMEEIAFSKDEDCYYENSDVHNFLLEFKSELEKRGAEFKTIYLDLTADDGTGWDNLKLLVKEPFLLTADMYRKYRRFISNKHDWWWLATAYSFSCPRHHVLYVDTGGHIDESNTTYESINVVPACVFSSLPKHDKRQEEIEDIKELMKGLQERLDVLENEV